MSSKHKDNGKATDPLAEFGMFTAGDLYDLFAAECQRAFDDGNAWHQVPGDLESITLPEGVLPGMPDLMNPVTKRGVPVVRVPLFTRADAPPFNPSSQLREALVAAGWTPPALAGGKDAAK